MCLKNINNNAKHSAKLVILIFNPLHHTWGFFAPSRGQNDYFGLKQPSWQRENNFANFEMAGNPSKSGKRFNLNSIPSFLGDIGIIKVVSEFSFLHSKCYFLYRKVGNLAKVAIFACQKMAFWVLEGKIRDHFYASKIP